MQALERRSPSTPPPAIAAGVVDQLHREIAVLRARLDQLWGADDAASRYAVAYLARAVYARVTRLADLGQAPLVGLLRPAATANR